MMKKVVRKFGTAPVFFTAISTILGAILFLRFGYAVGQVGFSGTVLIIIIGHIVTVPTAMAIAEIATNQKVEGGGEYFIISRSFGLVIGSTIGLALYFSQAISVAFYIIAFTEAFGPFTDWLISQFSFQGWIRSILQTKQAIGIPALLVLTYMMLTRGADLGVKALYLVVGILAISIAAFFLGQTEYAEVNSFDPYRSFSGEGSIPFFLVFAIIFPAFTGMTAGVGLSGDLRNPGRSIPLGTMLATITGMIVYLLISYKLAVSASPESLIDTSSMIMADIAVQGQIIVPLGLAAATISSALGSVMVAPRTLQAISRDMIFPFPRTNSWLSRGRGKSQEPYNASIVTIVIAAFFILLGEIDSVAKIISMFFMVTYGTLCLISFLNHFAADPSYRPRFRSRWYISLAGFLTCLILMFLMNPGYAVVAILLMISLYFYISFNNKDKDSLAVIFQGVIFQLSRRLHVFLQKAKKEENAGWRPSVIAISAHSFQHLGAFELLTWISRKYGFGTYLHVIDGYLSRESNQEAKECKERLIKMAENNASNIFIESIVSPSYTSAIAQAVQLPGVAGIKNNVFVFEFDKNGQNHLKDIVENLKLIKAVDFDVILLGSSPRGFGLFKDIHIWITSTDYYNANLMILLSYIILGHPDWKNAEIKIFAIYPQEYMEQERERLRMLIEVGRLPISKKNIELITTSGDETESDIIKDRSKDADLTLIGFREEMIRHSGSEFFRRFQDIGNVLFINSAEEIPIMQ